MEFVGRWVDSSIGLARSVIFMEVSRSTLCVCVCLCVCLCREKVIIGGYGGQGHQGRPFSLGDPNSFIFMQFLTKNLQNNRILGLGAPPQENPGFATD